MSSVRDICVVFKVGFDIMCADETLSEMYRHFKSHANSLHSSRIGMHDVWTESFYCVKSASCW